jgi:drug/metabolite transporter (DMT)-like permease
MEKFLIYVLVALTGGLFILCDSLSANWGKTGSLKSLLIVFGLAPTTYLLFGLLNQKISLGIAGSLVNLLIVIGTVLVGNLYFHEVLTKTQLIGVFTACLAMVLLSI